VEWAANIGWRQVGENCSRWSIPWETGARWAFGDPRPNELDPIVLLWWMQRRVKMDRIPRPRVVIEFEFPGNPLNCNYWFVIEPTGASVCLQHPRFDVDVIVTADLAAFYRVWLGRITIAKAVHRGDVRLDGMPADIRSFQHWFAWSPMADTVRAALLSEKPPVHAKARPKSRSGPPGG
jgi:hypothetical protein